MTQSLRQKSVSAFIWTSIGQYGSQIITFSISIMLARLLLPSDFGLVGMLSIFSLLSTTILNFGFNAALIQRDDIEQKDYSTIFYFNLCVSFVLYFLLYFAAPLIANFYVQPLLKNITRVYMLVLIINGFRIIQTTILTKEINFKLQVLARLAAAIISGIIGISMAFTGYGVWSLVAQLMSASFLNTVLLWIFNKWRPTFEFSFGSIKKLIGFSSRVFLSGLLIQFFRALDNAVIGKIFSASDLGFYTRAKSLKEFPVRNSTAILTRIIFPIFSTIKNDDERLLHVYKKFIGIVAFVIFPMMFGMITIADPLIRVLLTEKWLSSVLYLKLFCAFGFIYPLSSINLNIILVKGRSDIVLNLNIIQNAILVIAMIIGFQFGIKGYLIACIISSYFSYILNAKYSGKFLRYSVIHQLKDIVPEAITSLIMAVSVFFIGKLFGDEYVLKLVVQILSGITIYLSIAYVIKMKSFINFLSILRTDILKVNTETPKYEEPLL